MLYSAIMLVPAGKYRTEDNLKIQKIHELNTTQKRQTTQNTARQNNPGLVAFYNTRPGNEMGLFYNATKPIGSYQQQTRAVKN